MPGSGPTLVRRQLGRQLRRLREAAGKTERDVEAAKLASRTKLWRIESGLTPVKIPDVRALCWLYGTDASTTDALAGLALGTMQEGWWEEYGDAVPEWFRLRVDLESGAAVIRTYEPELVPGLFQIEAYAREVYRAARPDGSTEGIERHVEVRLERQRTVFARIPPPHIVAVLGAGVLARRVGGAQVMAEQTRRLRELSTLDHVEIRVLPWETGAHAAMLGAFVTFDFDDPDDPPVAYVECHAGARYLERPVEVDEYRKIFNLTNRQAVPIEEYSP